MRQESSGLCLHYPHKLRIPCMSHQSPLLVTIAESEASRCPGTCMHCVRTTSEPRPLHLRWTCFPTCDAMDFQCMEQPSVIEHFGLPGCSNRAQCAAKLLSCAVLRMHNREVMHQPHDDSSLIRSIVTASHSGADYEQSNIDVRYIITRQSTCLSRPNVQYTAEPGLNRQCIYL